VIYGLNPNLLNYADIWGSKNSEVFKLNVVLPGDSTIGAISIDIANLTGGGLLESSTPSYSSEDLHTPGST